MGRPRKSVEQLKDTGTYRPSSHDKRKKPAAKANGVSVEVPEYYSAKTRANFLTTYNYLNEKGILTEAECTSLINCFDLYELSTKYYNALDELEVTDKSYKVIFDMYVNSVRTFNTLIKGFGMLPADRPKVADLEVKEKKADSILNILTEKK